jgi:hypothetical protein
LVNASSRPQVLSAGTQTIAAVVVKTNDAPQSNGKLIRATAQLPGATAVSTQASVKVSPPAVGLGVSVTGPSQVHNGQTTQIAYQVTNQGTVDATAFTSGRPLTPVVSLTPAQALQMSWFRGATLTPAVTLGSLLPARRFSSWSSNSAGWNCSGSPLTAPTCSLTAAKLAVGETAPPLIIRFTLAQGQAATTPTGMEGSVVPWTVAIAQGMNGVVARTTQSQQLLVVPRPAGKLEVRLSAVTSSMVTSGQSVSFAVNHSAIDGFARGITDTLTIPNGLTTSAVNAGGWICPAGSGTVKCTFSGVVPPGGTPSYVITIKASESAPSGANLITVNSSGNAGESTATDMQPLFVVNIGGARLVLKRLLNSTSTKAVIDGSPLSMVPGLAVEAPFAVTNTGNRALAKGAVISLTAALTPAAAAYVRANPPSADDAAAIQMLLPPPIPGGPTCSLNESNFSATCSLTLTSPLDVNSQSPAFTFKPVVNEAIAASVLAEVPSEIRHLLQQGELFTVTASVTNNPDVIAPITLDLRTAFSLPDLPDLQPSVQTSSLKLGAAPSTVSLQLSNFGGAAGASVVRFTVPNSLRATAVARSACTVSSPNTGGSNQTVTCSVPALRAGSAQTPSMSTPIAFKLANVSATDNVLMSATVSLGGKVATSTRVQIPIDENPALTLSTPGNVQARPTSNAGELDVKFTPSSNAPSDQQYFAKACLNQAMSSSCVSRNVTSVSLLTGLAAGTRYYVTVTAAASGNYVASTSAPVSAVTGTVITPPPIDSAPGEVTSLSTALSSDLGRNPAAAAVAQDQATSTAVVPPVPYPRPAVEIPVVSLQAPVTPTSIASERVVGTAAMTGVPPSTGSNFRKICDDASASIGGGSTSLSADLGGLIAVSISGLSVSGSCASGATVSFTGASFNLYGIYSASVGAGTISASGFTINAGSLSTPSNWPGGAMTLPSTTPITLPFSASTLASSVSFQGSFSLGGLFGLPLPSGWTAQTTISFSYSNSVVGIGISSTAGPSGSGLTISGSADTTGNFSVSVSGNMSLAGVTISGVSASWASGSPFVFAGSISIGGSTLAVSGSYTNTSNWTFNANGSTSIFGTSVVASGSIVNTSGTVSGSFTMSMNNLTIAAGMTVNSLTMSWSPSAGLTGSGALVLGGTTLNLAGAYTNNNNWSFDANGSLSLFGSTVTASGTVSKSSGSMTGSYTMSMGTVSIASGLSVSGMTMSWSSANGLTGSGVIVLGSLQVAINASYSNSNNYTFTATTNGSGSITILPGVSISGAAFTGTISKASGVLNWNMSVGFSSITLISNLATLVNPVFTISNSCPSGLSESQCPAGNTQYFSATGTLRMNLGTGLGTQDVALTGVYGVQTGGFELSATFSNITVISGILTVSSPTIALSYNRGKTVSTGSIGGVGDGTVNGYTISISGTVDLDIPGFSQSVPVLLTYRPAGSGFDFTLTSDFPSVGTLGSTGAALASLVYTSASTSISLNGLNVTVPANTLVFGGEFVLPDWMATYLVGTLENVAL